MNQYDRQILALDEKDLEKFVRDWVDAKKRTYHSVARFSGSGDKGRDVVGFLSSAQHEGIWHNYQCKQYGKRLPTDTAFHEIGKVLYYAYQEDEFTVPDKYYFVVPRGLNRNLEKLVFNPTKFQKTLIAEWDTYCADTIVKGEKVALSPELKIFIEGYDFANVKRIDIDDILSDPDVKPVLFKWFGADPGPAPAGNKPEDVQEEELPYIGQLLDAYSDRESFVLKNPDEVLTFPKHHSHMQLQRERFYDADAFKRFYRDNTNPEIIKSFEKEIYHGIIETYNSTFNDPLYRIDDVMKQAAIVQPSGPLSKYAGIPIKQGICHHFANGHNLFSIIWRI